jgi:hypothetical protein
VCAAPTTEGRPADPVEPILLPDVQDLDALRAWIRERGAVRRKVCRVCQIGYRPDEEAAMLRRGWCYTCEANWLEPRLRRLIRRIGRKAALKAIRRLAR